MKLKFLCLFFLLVCVLSCGSHRSTTPQESHQAEIDQINALNAKIDMYQERWEKHDKHLQMYRQEMQRFRKHRVSQTGAAKKDLKAHIQMLK